eukprot:ANDGO_08297.mRNA.1 Serine protease/ABC transporter B family protein tagD
MGEHDVLAATLLFCLVILGHCPSIIHGSIQFRGNDGLGVDVESQLLALHGSAEGISNAFEALTMNAILEHPHSFSKLRTSENRLQFIVKRSRVVDPEWFSEIRVAAGAGSHVEYFPDDAALVFCDVAAASALRMRADTAFVVPVRSEWKFVNQVGVQHHLSESEQSWTSVLLSRVSLDTRQTDPVSLQDIRSVQNVAALTVTMSVAVAMHPAELDLTTYARFAADSLASLGVPNCAVMDVNDALSEFFLSVPKSSFSQVSKWLSRLNRVLAVTEKAPSYVMNSTGNKIVSSGLSASSTPYAGLLDGSGEIIHVADSGLDFFHCFFYDSVNAPLSSKNMVRSTSNERNARRKVVSYWQFMDNAWGSADHGTHVSGTAAGAATSSSASVLSSENGIASGAKIAFTDIGCQTSGGCSCGKTTSGGVVPCDCGSGSCASSSNAVYTPTSLDTGLFPYGLMNNALIATNSWGSTTTTYSTASRQIDSSVISNSSLLILFAAGNNGDAQTVSTQGASKNIITVGATTTGQSDFIDIVQNKVSISADGGYAYGTQILGCSASPASWNTACKYFMNSSSFDACSTSGRCAAGYTYQFSGGCGCFPCTSTNCYFIGNSYCSSCAVTTYQNTPATQIATNSLAYFSSTGATPDGRIKPDVVAPGYLIASSRSYSGSLAASDDVCGVSGSYQSFASIKPHLYATQGTSMATPLVAGYSALIRQYLRNHYPNAAGVTSGATPISMPPASLLKAMIVQSATPMNGIYCANNDASGCSSPTSLNYGSPFKQGFGLVDLRAVIPLTSTSTASAYSTKVFAYEDGSNGVIATSGAVKQYTYTISSTQCLRATLVWTDPLSSTSSSVVLVNDLDLKVTFGTDSFLGNAQYFGSADRVNNVERVIWQNAKAGTYTISVTGYRLSSAQSFSLVVSNMPPSLCVVIQGISSDSVSPVYPSGLLFLVFVASALL